jgi:nucleoporin GLE1
MFIYLLNMLVKTSIRLMPSSAQQTSYNAIDPIGVILSWIISHSSFRLGANSFADIAMAKFHKEIPPLFGIHGPTTTAAGRRRMGWRDGTTIQTHFDRMSALAIGWASVTLRNYSHIRDQESGIPAWRFWSSLAGIVNLPPAQLSSTHSTILKALFEQYPHVFVRFYGSCARSTLAWAVGDLPAQAPAEAEFAKLRVAGDNIKRKFGITV